MIDLPAVTFIGDGADYEKEAEDHAGIIDDVEDGTGQAGTVHDTDSHNDIADLGNHDIGYHPLYVGLGQGLDAADNDGDYRHPAENCRNWDNRNGEIRLEKGKHDANHDIGCNFGH